MEVQITGLETWMEKMKEMFNKDLEEIKKRQLKMNNARLSFGSGLHFSDNE